ncbi:glycosyltransferase [Paraflavisolibacter sp. H34]|uniref:glycosyltransferase n=1 Tax=Huijunlia imazamoxiresistens TaxID=3127457 RepID=UPI00301B1DE5
MSIISKRQKVLFIAEKGSLECHIPGGVQLCTRELIQYFELAGFEVLKYGVQTTRRILPRIIIRMGMDAYNFFDFKKIARDIAQTIRKEEITAVALNQIYLSPLIPYLKDLVSPNVCFIGLSHGNESGDFLHDITASSGRSLLQTLKLGRLIALESKFYKQYLDGVIVISEHEVGLNQWLGADRILVLPRKLQPDFLTWRPDRSRVGYVGTLNHLPNYEGLSRVARELDAEGFSGVIRLVGGPDTLGRKLAAAYRCVQYVGKLDESALLQEVQSWSVFLNPVFWYSRGSSTKLAQGLNWGIPVLSTPAGRRGYVLSDEQIITKDHQPRTFARDLINACSQQERLEGLKASVEKNVMEFDSHHFAHQLHCFCKNLQP